MTGITYADPGRICRSEIIRWAICFSMIAVLHIVLGSILAARPPVMRPLDEPLLAIAIDLEPPPPVPPPPAPPLPAFVPEPAPAPRAAVVVPRQKPLPEKAEPVPEPEAPPVVQNSSAPPIPTKPVTEITAAPVRPVTAPPSYLASLMGHLNRFKQYPQIAQQRRQTGTVMLSFTVAPDGRVLTAQITGSSGVYILDQEVLDLIHRAEPLPAMPVDMPQEPMQLTLPVPFTLR